MEISIHLCIGLFFLSGGYTEEICLLLNSYNLAQIALGYHNMAVRSEEQFSPNHRGIQPDTEATVIVPHPELNSMGGAPGS